MAKKSQYLQKLKSRNNDLYQYFIDGMKIVERLIEKTYEAYIVGGAVRDYILNEDFKDIDICTNATPKEILELFPNADTRYSEFGCVEINLNNHVFQVTTFRDENLVTTRKTKDIHYSKKLIDDVLRRDFTVNALALSSNYNVIDVVKGQNDIKKKIVRVIGNGKKKFHDDPLRIMRGLELVARFGFSLNHATYKAMCSSTNYIMDVSTMKLTESFYKILTAKNGREAIYQMIDMNLFAKDVVYKNWLVYIYSKYKMLTVDEKFALLYYMYGSIPNNTCFNKSQLTTFDQIIKMARIMETQPVDAILIYNYGSGIVMAANNILTAQRKKYKNKAKLIIKLSENLPIHSLHDLHFSPQELIQMMDGKKGPQITEILDVLVNKVLRNEVPNNNSLIRQEALKIIAMQQTYGDYQSKPTKTSNDYTPNDQVIPDFTDLLNEYQEDFNQMLGILSKGFITTNMSNEEINKMQNELKVKTKETLLMGNSKYKVLDERGLI